MQEGRTVCCAVGTALMCVPSAICVQVGQLHSPPSSYQSPRTLLHVLAHATGQEMQALTPRHSDAYKPTAVQPIQPEALEQAGETNHRC